MKPTTTTTTDADPSVAPTAALSAAADPAPTSPAEEGRQQYIIRRYRLDNITGDPIFIDETTSAYLDTVYAAKTDAHRIIICSPGGEANTLEIYSCRTPMHALAVLAVLHAAEDDQRQEPVEQMLTRYQREQQAEEPAP